MTYLSIHVGGGHASTEFYFAGAQPTQASREIFSRLKEVEVTKEDVYISFSMWKDSTYDSLKAKIPRSSLDSLLDAYGMESTNSLCSKSCTAIVVNNEVVGMKMLPNSAPKKKRKYLEIITKELGFDELQKVAARFVEITESNLQQNSALRTDFITIFDWAPLQPDYTGPTAPLIIDGELRNKWSQAYGRPTYRSGIFTAPLDMLVKDDKVIGFAYGEKPKVKAPSAIITIPDAIPAVPKVAKKEDVPITYELQYGSLQANIPPYLLSEFANNPKLRITGMQVHEVLLNLLQKSTETRVVQEQGSIRKKILYNESSPINSVTTIGDNLHEVSFNPRYEMRNRDTENLYSKIDPDEPRIKEFTPKKKKKQTKK